MSFLPAFSDISQAIGDPALDWLWVADISDPARRTPVLPTGVRLRSPASVGRFLYRIMEIPLQYRTIDTAPRYYRGRQKEYPGPMNLAQIPITFYESSEYDMIRMLTDWVDSVVSPDGTYSPNKEYVRDINFFGFNGVDRSRPVITGRYLNCWPTDISPQTYSVEGNNNVRWSVQFAVEEIEIS